MPRKFQGIIGPRVLPAPTYTGKPVTEAQKYELDLAKVQALASKLTGMPIRDSHRQVNLGRVTRNWVTSSMVWYVEIEIDDPQDGMDYVDLIRRGVLGNLSLGHDGKTMEPFEVSICARPKRLGSKILTEICEDPTTCGSNGDLYKIHADDLIINAAEEVSSEDAIFMSSVPNKDEKQESLAMDDEDALGAPPGPTGAGSGASSMKPPAPKPSKQQQQQQLDDLNEGAEGLSPAAPPMGSAPITPPPRAPVPPTSKAPAKQPQRAPQAPAPTPTPPPQKQPQQQNKQQPKKQPAPPAPKSDMDESDEDKTAEAPAAQNQGADKAASGAEQAAQSAQSALERSNALMAKVLMDSRISETVRKELHETRMESLQEINKLKTQIEVERKLREQAERSAGKLMKMAQSGKAQIANGLGTAMKSAGGHADEIENMRKLVMSDFGDKLVEQGGDSLILACEMFGEHAERREELEEAERRIAMQRHVAMGHSLETFQFSRSSVPSKPAAPSDRKIHHAKRSGGKGLTSESGITSPKDETSTTDEKQSDEKVLASEEPESRWSMGEYAQPAPADLMKALEFQQLRCTQPRGMEFSLGEAQVHVERGSKRSHPGASTGFYASESFF